ncbi:MAG: hypothetical protein K0A93_08800 [Desulfuromonadaceae bacterium]|nr:hypothetical protein [Desulfuromonadaceae bacterium]
MKQRTYKAHHLTAESRANLYELALDAGDRFNRKHFKCPHRVKNSIKAGEPRGWGPNCKGEKCSGSLVGRIDLASKIQEAMNLAEIEKAGLLHSRTTWAGEYSPARGLKRIEAAIRRAEAAGRDTTIMRRNAERFRQAIDTRPGRKGGRKGNRRIDGQETRLAIAVAEILKQVGAPVHDYAGDSVGQQVIFEAVAAVFGPLSEEKKETIRNAIKR